MCQDIQQVSFTCGHQTKFWWLKSRFCLFTSNEKAGFHVTYMSFARNSEKCMKCKIGKNIYEQGRVMKRADFRQAVEEQYKTTPDFSQEQSAKNFEAEARQAQSGLTNEKIAELQNQIKARIVEILNTETIKAGGKIVLLRTILGLPEIFDRKELVTLFGENYFRKADKERQLERSEKTKLFSMARSAGFERTLQASLKF
ncbi:hypothetical protein NPX13_g5519 [Xylaria arbuscula]|uniref:Uncharacterized protein n=1 Tax=Xylaria arbuscula TaxID=114810 RepID=A0A9W8TMB2_9PEZI|nr:hypothetical protein NPX13_g5519 [Xylaria arbuscula]